MSFHLHCPYCGELLAEDQQVVTTSTHEGTRQETYDLACRCGTRLRLQLPPERLAGRRRRHGRGRVRTRREAPQTAAVGKPTEESLPPPTAERPFPFTPWQYARLLMLRGRVQDGDVAEGPAATTEESPPQD